eukprot:6559348-Heterocapsa_arctica.AAC.1
MRIAQRYNRIFEKLIVEVKLGKCRPWRGGWQATNKDLNIAYMVCLNLFDRLLLNGRSFSLLMVRLEDVKQSKFGVDIPCSLNVFGRH